MAYRLNFQGLNICSQKYCLETFLKRISRPLDKIVVVSNRGNNFYSAQTLLKSILPDHPQIFLYTSNHTLLTSIPSSITYDLPYDHPRLACENTVFLFTDISFSFVTHKLLTFLGKHPLDTCHLFAISFLPKPKFKASIFHYFLYGVGKSSPKAFIQRVCKALTITLRFQLPYFYSFSSTYKSIYMCPPFPLFLRSYIPKATCQSVLLTDEIKDFAFHKSRLIYVDGNECMSPRSLLYLRDVFSSIYARSGKPIFFRFHPRTTKQRKLELSDIMESDHIILTSISPTADDILIGIASSGLLTFQSKFIVNLSRIVECETNKYNKTNPSTYFSALIEFYDLSADKVHIPSSLSDLLDLPALLT